VTDANDPGKQPTNPEPAIAPAMTPETSTAQQPNSPQPAQPSDALPVVPGLSQPFQHNQPKPTTRSTTSVPRRTSGDG
jgi:hypothetical protein